MRTAGSGRVVGEGNTRETCREKASRSCSQRCSAPGKLRTDVAKAAPKAAAAAAGVGCESTAPSRQSEPDEIDLSSHIMLLAKSRTDSAVIGSRHAKSRQSVCHRLSR